MTLPMPRMIPLMLAMSLGATAHAQSPAGDPLLTAAPRTVQPEQIASMQARLQDWPQLGHYRGQNAALPAAQPGTPRVVFYGDSITEGWGATGSAGFFPGKGYINRGISGQTTAQMLLRFRQDVVDLKPAVVVILAGTNDIAGNTGPASQAMIEDNLQSMLDIAQVHHIRVVLSSVLPVSAYPWRPGLQPAGQVRALNQRLQRLAHERGLIYLDYHQQMSNAAGGLDPVLAADGVHPTAAGYARMAPLAQAAVEAALAR